MLITIFLFVSIIRPFIRKLKSMNGLAWFPFLALLTTAALIPAYGFRPETLPLFIYAAVLSGFSLLQLARGGGRGYRDYRKRPQLIVALPLLLTLAVTAGIAFLFSPQRDTALSTQGVYTLRERGYHIRIYTEFDTLASRRPLLVMLPPALGSLAAVDQVAAELRDRGFTVLTGDRAGANPANFFRSFNAFLSGTRSARANARGRELEEARKADVRFFLSWIRQNPHIDGGTRLFDIASADTIFFAGYGAAGSALILMEDVLSMEANNIRGLIAIESPLWSLFRDGSPQPLELAPGTPAAVIYYEDFPSDAGWFGSIWRGLGRRVSALGPQRITGVGQVPQLSTPILFLASDQIREREHQSGRYRALLETFRSAENLAVLASADGAGPLDYSDFPVRYPLISALFPGQTDFPLRHSFQAAEDTAVVITNFAGGILESLEESPPLQRQLNPVSFQIESRNH